MNRHDYRKTKAKRSRTIVKIGLVFSLILLGSLTTYGVYLMKKAESAAGNAYETAGGRMKSELRDKEVEPLTDNVSILFIGVDDSAKREQDGTDTSLSDALMFATLNNTEHSIKLVSIPRDTYTYIPAAGYADKITHAYGYNGPLSTIESVEQLLEVPVDYYVKVDFDAFIDVVEAVGGIEVEVPYDLEEQDENDQQGAIKLKQGLQHLDGREALALARTRHYDNDIQRGQRQQVILEAILDEVLSASSFMRYGEVIDAVGNNMKTDMTLDEMQAFFEYAKDGMPSIENLTLAGYDDMSTNFYYWKLDEEELQQTQLLLQKHLEIE
ncbi:LCP family protein [Paenisporosarcina sp. TG20]|uniref:LCP family protein n=1 Tax=Paenisporosarcina sp. TG20 TaxID=1211706 RepID=UPI000316E938|nr:LCP family protein [Paenisporosarcina sp. TG20]